MKFSELDAMMRAYEKAFDQKVDAESWIIVRIDGRSFTRLTKEICHFTAPFDACFRDLMLETMHAVMDAGFNVLYGYTQSDEISLLFDKKDMTFSRKVRKINSILSGVASAAFSLSLGQMATFDCRVVALPDEKTVIDYFRWRQADAKRNALNAWCYWTLRGEGRNKIEATEFLSGQSNAFKINFLKQKSIDFDTLPLWQKNGIGSFYELHSVIKPDPLTGGEVNCERLVRIDLDSLPVGAAYSDFLKRIISRERG